MRCENLSLLKIKIKPKEVEEVVVVDEERERKREQKKYKLYNFIGHIECVWRIEPKYTHTSLPFLLRVFISP